MLRSSEIEAITKWHWSMATIFEFICYHVHVASWLRKWPKWAIGSTSAADSGAWHVRKSPDNVNIRCNDIGTCPEKYRTSLHLLTKQTFLTDSRRPAWIVMTLLVHPDWSYLPHISSRPIWHVLFFRSIVVTGTGNFDHVKFLPSEGLLSQSFSQAFHTSTFASKG